MSTYTVAECTQKDCAFYTPDPHSAGRCRCLHPDKPNYLLGRCPLFRLDWQKASRNAPPPPPRPAPPRRRRP